MTKDLHVLVLLNGGVSIYRVYLRCSRHNAVPTTDCELDTDRLDRNDNFSIFTWTYVYS